jgi:Flp pilus assembly protein TadD
MSMAQLTIQQAFELAVRHHQAGQLPQAENLYRQILAQQPEHVDAVHNLGMIAHQVGRHDVAVGLIRQAIAIKPGMAEAHYNLGIGLSATGRLKEAIAAYRQAIFLKPDYPEAYCNLGNVLKDKGQLDDAIAAFRQAIVLKPAAAEAHSNLGNALRHTGQLGEAIAACRRAIALNPQYPEAHNNLGVALRGEGELDEAVAACRQAIALKPNYPEAHNNLGIALREKGQLDEAIAACRKAIALKPDLPEAHYNLALTLLLRGDLLAGWAEYEWRWKCEDFPSPRRNFVQPQWNGSDSTDRIVLLHVEQGLGDAIQFIRYVPMLAERASTVVVVCQPELQRLLQFSFPDAQFITPSEPLPPFDFYCPALSLPSAFGTTLQTIPNSVPYLQTNSGEIERWRERLAGKGTGFKVGLAWAGSSKHANDRNRSLSLSFLSPLAQIPNVNFYSLQKGDAATQARNPSDAMKLVDWTEELKDFADTAALIANLDLVITVDTAVAHLAGAMGKPVWVLLPFVPDWRWMMDREDSPWYPTMRLFRQKVAGQWDEVITRVADSLAKLSKSFAGVHE